MLLSELSWAFSWYLALALIGLAGLPLALRLLRALPSRGYAFARPLSLLLVSYALWLFSTFGIIKNHAGAILALTLLLGALGWLNAGWRAETIRFWRERRRLIGAVELLFFGSFALLALLRAFVPEITGTEKPMEFAFLNSIIRSESFPPADPWLSGYSISYYYFGYLLASTLTLLSGVPSGAAFNLNIASLFGLTAIGAFSVGYDLVASLRERQAHPDAATRSQAPYFVGLMTSVAALLVSNLSIFFEMLHARGFGSREFWEALALKDLNHPYVSALGIPSDRQDFWWWFRAARVIMTQTNGTTGSSLDYTINEFPAFSFILADMHPHVLALPFAFLGMSLALALLRSLTVVRTSGSDGAAADRWAILGRPRALLESFGLTGGFTLIRLLAVYLILYPLWLLRAQPLASVVGAVVFGGFWALNAWDMPTYLFVLVLAFALGRFIHRPSFDGTLVREVLTFGWLALSGSVFFYLPFYVGFRSQASGLGLVQYHSQLHHFLIFWTPLLLPVALLVVFGLMQTIVPGSGAISSTGGLTTRSLDRTLRPIGLVVGAASLFFLATGLPAFDGVISPVLRIPALGVILPLLLGIVTLARRLLGPTESEQGSPTRRGDSPVEAIRVSGGALPAAFAPEHLFALLLMGTALLLISGAELVFIRDLFNNRMNTVFKLYYQSWALLSVGAVYSLYYLYSWAKLVRTKKTEAGSGVRAGGARLALGVAAFLALFTILYPITAVISRIDATDGIESLDGTAYLARSNPGELGAIRWLWGAVDGNPVILEAQKDGSYSQYARVSAATGLPTILGWDFHEQQWRGPNIASLAERKSDIDTIYTTTDRTLTRALLTKYGVTYVYVGSLENEKYAQNNRPGLAKFAAMYDTVYNSGGVTIYRVR